MRYLKFSLLVFLSLIMVGGLGQAEDWTKEILPIEPGVGVEAGVEFQIDVKPMEVSYATILKRGTSFHFILLLKNATKSNLEIGKYSYKGYHNSHKIFGRWTIDVYPPEIIRPGSYYLKTVSYSADDNKTISLINRVEFSYDFSKSDLSDTRNLEITNISTSGWGIMQAEIINTSENAFIEGDKTSMQLQFFNKKGLLIGWKNFLGTETIVPGGKRLTKTYINKRARLAREHTVQRVIEDFHQGEVEVKVTGLPILSSALDE